MKKRSEFKLIVDILDTLGNFGEYGKANKSFLLRNANLSDQRCNVMLTKLIKVGFIQKMTNPKLGFVYRLTPTGYGFLGECLKFNETLKYYGMEL